MQITEAPKESQTFTLPQVGKWYAVESSNLAAAKYDPKVGLLIKFKTGKVYRYPELGASTLFELLGAESKGKYFHKHIRPQTNYSEYNGE
jgi:hypothetical protein